MALLELHDICVAYGAVQALQNVSINIEEGQITAIIGSNGAGKTTLINTISGIVKYSGEIFFDGAILSKASNTVVKKGIVQVPEGRKVFPGLTVDENLMLGAYTLKNRSEISSLLKAQYDLFPRLAERHDQDAGTLSGGEQQMLVICRALMAKPRILMLDEPSLGLAPIVVKDVFETVLKIKETGTTVIIVEQNANKSLSISDYGYVLENGCLSMEGTGKDLLGNEKVANAYLGGARK